MPRCATIGLKMGEPEWATNHPRLRGITHIAQIVRHPEDDAPFVSEAIGVASEGIRLTAGLACVVAPADRSRPSQGRQYLHEMPRWSNPYRNGHTQCAGGPQASPDPSRRRRIKPRKAFLSAIGKMRIGRCQGAHLVQPSDLFDA